MAGRRKVYYGWWLLAAVVPAQAVLTGVSFWSFGLYIKPLEDQFGWSRAEVSLGFSVALLISGLTAPLVGKAIDVYGPRRVIVIGAVLSVASYLLLATTSSLWQWYAYQSINAVFRQMIFFIPFTALIAIWFDRRRGTAIGILATGFALGGMVMVPVMRVVIDSVEWDGSFLVSAALIGVLFLPLGLLLVRNRPADVGAEVDGEPRLGAAPKAPVAPVGMTLSQALRTPLFWALALAFAFFFYGLFGWTVHAIPYYESVGLSPGWAVAFFSIASGAAVLTRLTFGILADRIRNIERAAAILAVFFGGRHAGPVRDGRVDAWVGALRAPLRDRHRRRTHVRAALAHPVLRYRSLRHDPGRRGGGGHGGPRDQPHRGRRNLRRHRRL